jgi:muconolactone delta-isomerase
MLFLVETDIDLYRLAERRDEVFKAEWAAVESQWTRGVMLRLWRKANGKGIIGVWDVPDNEALRAELTALPLFVYFSDVRVTALVAHPQYPEHATADSGPAARGLDG